jgi:hypothetical protein
VDAVSAEILINQAAQGLRSYAEVKTWFEEHSDLDQLSLLREIGHMALQAGTTSNDALRAAEQTGTKVGAPAVVLMSKDAPKVQMRKVLQLPKTEYARTFVLLIGLLSVADARRRETKCRGNCTHWWHRDLSDGVVVRELLASRRSNEA